MAQLTYNPDVFRVPDEKAAREIILTQEGAGTEERWSKETPYLAELLGSRLQLQPGALLVDFGCGIGRMARELIIRQKCRVLGVDISEDMRRLAPSYVRSEAFSVVSSHMFESMVAQGLRYDAAISVWVIQHCLNPANDLDTIRHGLKQYGRLGIVNNKARAVPTKEKPWASDGLDVQALLGGRFDLIEQGSLDPCHVGPVLPPHTFWGIYSRR